MAVPSFKEMYNIILQSLQDGTVHSNKDCREYIKSQLNLTEDEFAETVPSGEPKWINRINWGRVHLKKAGLFISPKDGQYQITERGLKLLAENVKITNALLIERFPEYAAFMKRTPTLSKSEVENNEETQRLDTQETPQEVLNRAYREINDNLSDELLKAVLNVSPRYFENLVVKLMEAMDYGTGEVTQYVKDGGIDGIIYGDKLKFDRIGIQAKHFSVDSTIGAPAIHQFIGALEE